MGAAARADSLLLAENGEGAGMERAGLVTGSENSAIQAEETLVRSADRSYQKEKINGLMSWRCEMESSKSIVKLAVTCAPQLVEVLSDYLMGVLEAAVETGVEDRLLAQRLYAYVEKETATGEEVAALVAEVLAYGTEMASIFGVEPPEVEAELLENEDWASNWKKHFTPFAITEGLVIKPSWEEYQPKAGEAVIEMDPGMAFGTGQHETTSLCMQLIKETLRAGSAARVLDVGTGTGILAMAAALFGADGVLGIDNDPDAVLAAADNVAHNDLKEKVEISITPLEEVEGQYQLVVANIIHDVLVSMRAELTRCTAPGGVLILSGILAGEQADNIRRYFGQVGFTCGEQKAQGEWAALRLIKG